MARKNNDSTIPGTYIKEFMTEVLTDVQSPLLVWTLSCWYIFWLEWVLYTHSLHGILLSVGSGHLAFLVLCHRMTNFCWWIHVSCSSQKFQKLYREKVSENVWHQSNLTFNWYKFLWWGYLGSRNCEKFKCQIELPFVKGSSILISQVRRVV